MSAALAFDRVLVTRGEYTQNVSGAWGRDFGEEQASAIETSSPSGYLLTSADSPPDSFTATSLQDLRAFFEFEFKTVSEVARVKVSERVKHGNRVVHVWTMLHRDDRETRFKVYEVEDRLTALFPELLFEFHTHKVQPDAPEGDSAVYES